MSTLKVDGIRSNSASSDAITLASDGTCTANITSNGSGQLSNRNKIINGAMVIAQRGTSFTPSGTEQPYTLDRWNHIGTSGINFDSTDTQSTDAPEGFGYSMKITPDSTESPTGGANACVRTTLEGWDFQDIKYGTSNAKKVTLSFYAKSSSQNNGHQYSVELVHYDSSSNRRQINRAFTITSSWQRFTMTFDGDTSNNVVNGNGSGYQVIFHLAAGSSDVATHTSWNTNNYFNVPTGQSNFLDNTSNEFYLTGVQLEVGSVATDFEHRSYGQERALCFRYYQKIPYNGAIMGLPGRVNGTTVSDTNFNLTETMRATPTCSVTTSGGTYFEYGSTSVGVSSVSVAGQSSENVFLRFSLSGSASNGSASYMQLSSGSFVNCNCEF